MVGGQCGRKAERFHHPFCSVIGGGLFDDPIMYICLCGQMVSALSRSMDQIGQSSSSGPSTCTLLTDVSMLTISSLCVQSWLGLFYEFAM